MPERHTQGDAHRRRRFFVHRRAADCSRGTGPDGVVTSPSRVSTMRHVEEKVDFFFVIPDAWLRRGAGVE